MKNQIKKITNSIFAIFYYLLITIVVSIIFLLIKYFSSYIVDISRLLENTIFIIIFELVIVVISMNIFIRIFTNKYIIGDSKEGFLNKFFAFLIISFTLSLIVNLWNGSQNANMRIFATMKVNEYILYNFNKDPETFNSYTQNTPYEKCKNEEELWDTTNSITKNIIYDEIIRNIVFLIIESSANVIFIIYFIKRKKLQFNI